MRNGLIEDETDCWREKKELKKLVIVVTVVRETCNALGDVNDCLIFQFGTIKQKLQFLKPTFDFNF